MGEPLKSRLILEMAADLESMADHFRRRGMSEGEAVAAAEERLLTSPHTLAELVRVHTTGVERLAARVAWAVRTGLDLALFVFALSPLAIAAAYAITGQIRTTGMDAGSVLVLALGALILATAGRAEWLLRHRFHEQRRTRSTVNDLLYLGAFTFAVGAASMTIGVVRVLDGLSRGGSTDAIAAVAGLTSAASTFALALLVALASAFSWFILVNRLAIREQRESAALVAV